jgi:hypothetical protein
VFLATANELMQFNGQNYGYFTYSPGVSDGEGTWTSTLSVKEETQYYMYGYMPSSVTCDAPTPAVAGDYSKGLDITFTGLPCITKDDICVIVGVQRVTKKTELPDKPTVTEGNYGYHSGTKGQNYVNVLMAHLFSRLDLCFKIDPDYAELRSIHLKEVTLTSKYGTISATVNLRDGEGLGNPVFPAANENNEALSETLFKSSDSDPVVPEKVLDKALAKSSNPEMAIGVPVYCSPVTAEVGSSYNLTLTTTYDVYDKSGNKLEEEPRKSVNKITLNSSAVKPGYEKKLVLTIKPTYLYILSDNDLNNPVIDVNEGS